MGEELLLTLNLIFLRKVNSLISGAPSPAAIDEFDF